MMSVPVRQLFFAAFTWVLSLSLIVLYPGGGGESHIIQTGMLVVSLRGINFGFWSRLGVNK